MTDIIPVESIIPGLNAEGLVGLEGIAQGDYGPLSTKKFADVMHPKMFAWHFLQYTDYLVGAVESFDGQVVVDLGAGRSLDGYILAKIAGAIGYVAVDHGNLDVLHAKLKDPVKSNGDDELNEKIKKMHKLIGTVRDYDPCIVEKIQERIEQHLGGCLEIPVALAPEDMLVFLRRIPQGTVSILACGIDKQMVWDNKYAADVESEMARVLHPKGAYLSMQSRFEPPLLTEHRCDASFTKYSKQ